MAQAIFAESSQLKYLIGIIQIYKPQTNVSNLWLNTHKFIHCRIIRMILLWVANDSQACKYIIITKSYYLFRFPMLYDVYANPLWKSNLFINITSHQVTAVELWKFRLLLAYASRGTNAASIHNNMPYTRDPHLHSYFTDISIQPMTYKTPLSFHFLRFYIHTDICNTKHLL